MKKQKPVVFLEGKRLYLRPIEEPDLERCRQWVNDPYVRQFILRQMPVDEIAEKQWHDARPRNPFPFDVTLAIVLKRGHRHIGNTGIHQIDWVNRRAITGAIIGERDCLNRGYGSEAKGLILRYAFDTLGLNRICSAVLVTNPRSLAYLKKCGYREEGRLREHIFRDGKFVDEITLAILASEWRAKQKQTRR